MAGDEAGVPEWRNIYALSGRSLRLRQPHFYPLLAMTTALLFKAGLLAPIAMIVTYFDVIHRRIPNPIVVVTLATGLALNFYLSGWSGLIGAAGGCAAAFTLMLGLHFFGALGPGDVKLFAAIGAMIGLDLVLKTFVVVVLTGGVLAVISMIRWRSLGDGMHRVGLILAGLLPGWKYQRLQVPADKRKTIPYGVAIMFGSLIALVLFNN